MVTKFDVINWIYEDLKKEVKKMECDHCDTPQEKEKNGPAKLYYVQSYDDSTPYYVFLCVYHAMQMQRDGLHEVVRPVNPS